MEYNEKINTINCISVGYYAKLLNFILKSKISIRKYQTLMKNMKKSIYIYIYIYITF